MAGLFFMNFLRFLLLGLEILIFVRVVLSWVDPHRSNPFAAFVYSTTEPILAPIRRLMPRSSGFDLSPWIVIIIIGVLLQALR